MATAPSDPRTIVGRVDRNGRLVSADPELERLQVEAGSRVGASLALPQLANVARLAQNLRIPVSRRVLAAGRDQDIDMWVRAVPEGEDVVLAIEQWSARPASPPRLETIAAVEHERLAPEPLTWAVDEHLRLVRVAPTFAELLSLDPADVSDQPLTKLFRLEEDDSGTMPLLDALASRTAFAGQRVRLRNDGKELELSGEVASASDGSFAGFEGTAVLVTPDDSASSPSTPRPIVRGAIETALRSPLDNIVRSAEEMIERSDGDVRAEYAAYAADIAAAARHLLSVVRSLGARTEVQRPDRVDVATLAWEAVSLVESAAKDRGIAIAVERDVQLFAQGESRSVVQILVNLLTNAIRYAPEGSAVTVSFASEGRKILVQVADEGPGIDASDQERIFEPFQKGSPDSPGSGLGLAIARRLSRAMGGEVRLQSIPGEGARFTLELAAA